MVSAFASRRALGRVADVFHRGTKSSSSSAPLGFKGMKPPASSWASANSFSATPVVADPPGVGLFEFRVTSVHPKSFQSFTDACVSHAATRRRVEPGFLGSWRTNVGGDLFELVEMIHHKCNDSRDSALAMMQKDPAWRVFTEITAPMLQKQSSEMFLPAVKCLEVAGGETDAMLRIKNLSAPAKTPPGVFELRTYQLELGYNPIPKLIELMAHGLPSKLASDQKKKGTLVGMFFSDVGRLNRFVEIWRYETNADHILVREAARGASEWRETIGQIAPMVQMFDTKLCVPTDFSPIQ